MFRKRNLFLLASAIAIIGAVIVSLSIHPSYKATVKLSIESSDKNILESFDMMSGGIPLSIGKLISNVTTDPYIYQHIVTSTDFIEEIKTIPVKSQYHHNPIPYKKYLEDIYKRPWWERLLEPFHVNDLVQKNLSCAVNPRNDLLTFQIRAQETMIASSLADSLVRHLEKFMIQYALQKARIRTENLSEMRREAGRLYHEAVNKKTQYVETHEDAGLPSSLSEMEALSQEIDRTMTLYNSIAKQYTTARMQEQQSKPTFTIVSKVVDNTPSNPKWLQNLFIWLFYSFAVLFWGIMIYNKVTQYKKEKTCLSLS